MIQQYAIKNSRLHIPVIFGVDAVHGFGHPYQAPLYPAVDRHGRHLGSGCRARRGRGHRTCAAGHRMVLGLRPGAGPRPRQPVGPHLRDLGRGAGARVGDGRREHPRPAVLAAASSASATVKHFAGYSQSINGHDRNEALLPLSYLQSVILPSYTGWDRRRRADGDGRFRFDQRSPGNRVALPADRHPARPDGLQGRRDQRLPGRPRAADRVPHRARPRRGDRQGGQRGRRHEHAGVRRPTSGRPRSCRTSRPAPSRRRGSTRRCVGSSP